MIKLGLLRSGTTGKRRLTAISAALFTSLFLMTQTIPVMGQATPPDFSRYGTNKLLEVDLPENVSGEQARGVLVTTVLAIGLSPINYTIIENHVIGASDAYGIDRMTVGDIYYKGPALDYEALTPAERTHSLKVRAQNALGSDELIVKISVTSINERPVRNRNLPNQTMTTGGLKTIDLSSYYSDPDPDDRLVYTVTSNQNGVVIPATNGSHLSLRARGSGSTSVNVAVTDIGGLGLGTSWTPDQSFKVTVLPYTCPTMPEDYQPVQVSREIENQDVVAGGKSVNIWLADSFTGVAPCDTTNTYIITSTSPHIASARVVGDYLEIWGREVGNTTINVRAQDSFGTNLGEPQVFSVSVGTNRPPVISRGNTFPGWVVRGGFFQYSIDEAVSNLEEIQTIPAKSSSVEAILTARDSDQDDSELVWSVEGEDSNGFRLVRESEGSASFKLIYQGSNLDYESQQQLTFNVVVTDYSGATDTATVVLWLNDIYETPNIVTEHQDITLPLNTVRSIDFSHNVAEYDADPVYYTAKVDPHGVVDVIHQGLIDRDQSSSRIRLNLAEVGETTLHYCVTDQSSIVADLQQDEEGFNVRLYDACFALPEDFRVLDDFKITVTPPSAARTITNSPVTFSINPVVTSPPTASAPLTSSPPVSAVQPISSDVPFSPPASSSAELSFDGRFQDDDESVHNGNIERIAEMGITSGCNPPENTRFCPLRHLSRGEMATFLVRAFNLPPTSQDFFTDDATSTHEKSINRLAAAKITSGCNPGSGGDRYCPTKPINRAEMASFLVRILNLTEEGDGFSDIDTIHAPQIRRIQAAGITLGCNPPVNSRYCPERPLTRAEFASLLVRSISLNERG